MEKEDQTNRNLQAEEIEVLAAIFGEEFMLHSDNAFSVKVLNSPEKEFYLHVTYPENYPLHSSPKYDINAPWMKRESKMKLSDELKKISCQNKGECVIFLWTSFIKDFLEQDSFHIENNEDSVADEQNSLETERVIIEKEEILNIAHGQTIKDRKSVFQAHLAHITSVEQVNKVLEKLMENKKIATATHNMYAYRIKFGGNGKLIQDCEDDGESKAGSVLLHLLEVLNLTDIMVVVTRWYGGIHLGSLRFKHISDAAKNLIDELELVKEEKTDSISGRKCK